MDDLQRLESWLAPLLARLDAAQRRSLTREVAQLLRTKTQQNMQLQQAPDGSAWQPRKNRSRDKRGRLRTGAMFSKLRKAKHLKAQVLPEGAVVQIVGRAERLARVHHFGLRDRVMANGPEYDYPARPLMGITDELAEQIEDLVIKHLAA